MFRKIFSIPFVLWLVLVTVSSSHATTVERLDLEALVKKARTIVVGKVLESRTYWSADGKFILTDYTIEVDENLKGQGMRSVAVTTVGGKIGDLELHVSGMPAFQKGEQAVVFIEQSGAYQTVVGLGQGKFTVTNGDVTNAVDGLAFPDGRPGDRLKMPLESFKTRVRGLVNR